MVTPNEAAGRAGVSRPTVMKAIHSMALKASRNNKNQWQISEEDLQEWMQQRVQVDTVVSLQPVAPEVVSPRVTELEIEVAELKGKLSGKDELIDQLRQDLEYARLPWWRRLIG